MLLCYYYSPAVPTTASHIAVTTAADTTTTSVFAVTTAADATTTSVFAVTTAADTTTTSAVALLLLQLLPQLLCFAVATAAATTRK